MGLLIDTSYAIDMERRRSEVDFSPWAEHGEVFIAAITAAELLLGVYLAALAKQESERRRYVERVRSACTWLDFDYETADIHAQMMAQLRKKGLRVGAHDAIIAATALRHNCAVLTLNDREFSRIAGLEVVRP